MPSIPPSTSARSWVYFVQAGEGGPVKIGQTRQVRRRVRILQVAHFETIRLLGTVPETVITERYLHSHFRHQHIRGEWFQPVPDLLRIAEAGAAIFANGYVSIWPEEHEEQAAVLLLHGASARR